MSRFSFLVIERSTKLTLDFELSYFDNIPRLAQPGFLPSDQDILRSRVKSVGISETVLDISGRKLRLVDVGGQRSERRKWAGVFEDVEVLLFLISVSGTSSSGSFLSSESLTNVEDRSRSTTKYSMRMKPFRGSRKRRRCGLRLPTRAGFPVRT